MLMMLKEPGLAPSEVNIPERLLTKAITTAVGAEYMTVPFGDEIAVLFSDDAVIANFRYLYHGRRYSTYGPVVFLKATDSGFTGLDSDQAKILRGCFKMPYRSDNTIKEICDFLSLIYEGREGEILERKNVILERSVVLDTVGPQPETVTPVDPDEYINIHSGRTYNYEDDAYVDRHASKDETADDVLSEEEISEAVGLVSGSDTEPAYSAEPAPSDKPDACEAWFVSYLLENADEDMSARAREQIVDVLLDKFRILISRDEDFHRQMQVFVEGEKSQEEKAEFFRFVTSALIHNEGVKEEYAKRHPDEYRIEEDRRAE